MRTFKCWKNQNKIRRWVRVERGNARVANKDSFPTYISLLQTKVSCHVRVEELIAAVDGKVWTRISPGSIFLSVLRVSVVCRKALQFYSQLKASSFRWKNENYSFIFRCETHRLLCSSFVHCSVVVTSACPPSLSVMLETHSYSDMCWMVITGWLQTQLQTASLSQESLAWLSRGSHTCRIDGLASSLQC